MTLAISWPSVLRLARVASIRPSRDSLRISAPPTRIARPSRLRNTIRRPRREPNGQPPRRPRGASSPAWASPASAGRSGFAVAIPDAIKGLDGVEGRIDFPELLAHPLDVAVDGAVIDIDLILVGGVHQVVAALHEARPLGQRLQQQKLGHRQANRLFLPQAVMAGRIEGQPPPLDRLGPRRRAARRAT